MAKIYIGVPNMGNVRTGLWIKSLKWITEGKHDIHIFPPMYVRPIPSARNLIVKEFLKLDHEFLLMIDADIEPPENVLDMSDFNCDVISAVCFVNKENDVLPMVLNKTGEGYSIVKSLDANSLVEVDAVGTGCIMIRREVLKTLAPPYFSYVMDHDGMLKLGEDFHFCSRVQQHNFRIYAHTGYIAEHFTTTGLSGMNAKFVQRLKEERKTI